MEKANLTYHSVALFVNDIEISKDFYTRVMELRIEQDFGKNVILEGGITLWEVNPAHILVEKLGAQAIRKHASTRHELYFETEDIAAVLEKMINEHVKLLHGLHEEPWGQKTMRFFDPDWHLIEIGERLETFIRRLARQDFTPKQVSDRSGVPLENVNKILAGG